MSDVYNFLKGHILTYQILLEMFVEKLRDMRKEKGRDTVDGNRE